MPAPMLARYATVPLRQLSAVLLLSILSAAAPAAGEARWIPLGPEGGSVLALAFAPADPGVVYAAVVGGGVFQSRDGGASWRGPGGGLAGAGLYAAVLAVDPRDPAVAYAAAPDGIWKTASGGAFWVHFPAPLAGIGVVALAIDPVHSRIVYAGTDHGLFRSDNGGRRWAARNAGLPEGARVEALDVDPNAPANLVVAVTWSDSQAGLFRSLDGAATWTRLTGAPAAGFSRFARASHTLYGVGSGSLFRSDDDGTTWIGLPLAPASLAGRIESLAVDPGGAVYVRLGQEIAVSADRGESFTSLASVAPFETVLALAAGPGGAVLVGSEDFGVLRRVGATFVASNRGLTASSVTGVEIDPNDSAHLYAAVLGGGLFESMDRGVTWLPHNGNLSAVSPVQPPVIGALALAPSAPSRLFLTILRGIAASTDGGSSWRFQVLTDCTALDVLAIDPRGRDVYASYSESPTCGRGACYALASHDSGKTFRCLPTITSLDAVLVDPVNSATVYLAGDLTLFKSVDGGKSLHPANSGLELGRVLALAESPAAPRVIYAGEDFGGVWKSTDAATHWTPTGPGLPAGPVVALVVDPADARRVYAGVRGVGVFASQNGGASWQPLGADLPGAVFNGPLRIAGRGPHTLYAGTLGSGLWAMAIP